MMNELNKAQSFKKDFIWNMIGSTLNGFISLFLLIIVTRINGLEDAGIFSLAFSIACLLYIVGGYAGKIYQITDVNCKYTDSEYICHKIITCSIMLVLSFIYCIYMRYTQDKFIITILLCTVKAMEAFSDSFLAILQKNNKLYLAGISLTMKSLFTIILFLIFDLIFSDLLLSCIIINIVWITIIVFFDLRKSSKYIDFKVKIKKMNLLKLFKTGFYPFGVLFLTIYISNAPKYALDGIMNESLQAIFGIIIMPATLVSLCVQYILQPYLNSLSNFYKLNDKIEFKKLINKLVFWTVLIGIFILIGSCVLGIPILSFIYSVQLENYYLEFIIIMIGAIFFSITSLLATALTTIRKIRIQFLAFLLTTLVTILISNPLIVNYGLMGSALLYFTSTVILTVMFTLFYINIIKKIDFSKNKE